MIKKTKNKKSQTDQIFVYIFSIIVILFAGFLVTKFIGSFLSDTDKVIEDKFYDQFEVDYNKVYATYGSENIFKYKVSSQIKLICFISNKDEIDNIPEISDDIKEELNAVYGPEKENIMMFDNTGILNSRKIGEFRVDKNIDDNIYDTSSICIKPNSGFFSLMFENYKNDVYISEI